MKWSVVVAIVVLSLSVLSGCSRGYNPLLWMDRE